MFAIHTNKEPYKYIMVAENNKMCLTEDINKATLFTNEKTVRNIVDSSLNSKKKRVHTYTYSEINKLPHSNESVITSIPTGLAAKKPTYVDPRNVEILDNIIKETQVISNYVNKIQSKIQQLSRNLSNVDKACAVLDHHMEFHNLSASDGWKVYKQYQKLLKIRRQIKNQIFAYKKIVEPLSEYEDGKIEKTISGLKTAAYTPTTMTHLFKNDI